MQEEGMEDKDPYAEGVEAAHKGKIIAHCPYPFGSVEANEWIDGFESVKQAD
jgi:hypothetical protein